MQTKFIFSTETKDTEHWADLPIVPRLNEWINLRDLLSEEKTDQIKQSANCWSGSRGIIQSIEYRFKESEAYTEIFVWCED